MKHQADMGEFYEYGYPLVQDKILITPAIGEKFFDSILLEIT